MTTFDRLGPSVVDRQDWTPPPPSLCDAPLPDAAPIPPAPRRRIWLWVGIAALAAGLAAGWPAAGRLASTPPRTSGIHPSIPPPVANTAELFMAMYLNGTSGEEITRLYTGEPPPPSGTWVGEAAAISGQQTGTDSWEVTVAVDSLEASDGGYSPAPLAFYVVPVSTAEGHATVLAAPARVPGPARRPAAPAPDAAVPTDLGEAAARFVELYLTGGDTALLMVERAERFRWFAPGVYGSATAEALGVDRLGRVTVAAQATTERGAVHRLEYLVTLTGSDRGWVVAEIGPAGK